MRHRAQAILTHSTAVRIGPLIARVSGSEPAVHAVRRRHSGFGAVRTARCDVELQLLSDEIEGPPLSGEMPRQKRARNGELLLESTTYRARISPDGKRVTLEGPGWGEGLAAALQQAAARRLVPRKGLLLHAALLRWGRGVALFTGPSGAGKSTVAHHAQDLALCDELAVVLPEGGRWVAHATPYNQGRRGRGRIGALFLLGRGKGCRTEGLAAPRALRELLQQVVLADPADQGGAALATAAALLEQVPAYSLRFRPGAALRDFLEGQGER